MDCSDPKQIIDVLEQAAALNRLDPYRQEHLLKLPNYGQVIMTGDFHGCLDNFCRLVWFADLERCMDRHVIIHELIHSNGANHSADPSGHGEDCSCLLLIQAAQWKIDYPDQVHFLLGNHDLAQMTSREITKGGAASIANFNRWIVTRFGDTVAATILDKIGALLETFPLAARSSNRIWFSHSLPGPSAMDAFDFSVFARPWQSRDLVPRGSVYETVWGRSHSPAQLNELAEMLDVDFFVLGHQCQAQGFDAQADRLIILASDHGQGCFLPVDLSRAYTFTSLVGRIKFFSELPDPAR